MSSRVTALIFLFVFLTCAGLFGQDALTNDTVMKLLQAGLGEEVILTMVNTQPAKYSLAAEDLIKLKEAGVSDAIIAAMVQRNAGITPTPDPSEASATSDEPLVPEIGVYYKKDGRWVDIPPEVVNWKTGGILKTVATAGIVKGDVNGRINTPNSPTKLALPVEFLIYAPEGTAVTEYQLLDLREKDKAREFRTVTGGVLHASGGATRDLVSYKADRIAPRHYVTTVTNLAPGEYGFLPPNLAGAQSASAQLGKMYTFSIIE